MQLRRKEHAAKPAGSQDAITRSSTSDEELQGLVFAPPFCVPGNAPLFLYGVGTFTLCHCTFLLHRSSESAPRVSRLWNFVCWNCESTEVELNAFCIRRRPRASWSELTLLPRGSCIQTSGLYLVLLLWEPLEVRQKQRKQIAGQGHTED